ncbi:MAG: AbrB/MazE/SpoVT family DNA-binding domain-containing protein [Intestinimonas sp.]|jgi:transcriptional pleiotropic regulator of transition state genes|nr:AbrB/MazE/SpoVT family DNA-binding domain-containing protein [Intestinimonas sp.]
MKATGITRRVDELGRVVLPVELRRVLEIEDRAAVEIFTDGDSIVLRKYNPGCALCGSTEGLVYINKRPVCAKCAEEIRRKTERGR